MVGARREAPVVTVRRAGDADSARVLAWRNDPQTRAMSIDSAEIGEAEHTSVPRTHARCRRSLALHRGGSGRSRRRGPSRSIEGPRRSRSRSPSLPTERGKGFALALLHAAEAEAAKPLGAVHLVAVIRPDNIASRKAFEAAGYRGFVAHAEAGVALVRCERRIAPYRGLIDMKVVRCRSGARLVVAVPRQGAGAARGRAAGSLSPAPARRRPSGRLA